MDFDISLNQLIVAYHKAKNEVFFEGSEPILMGFVTYEKNLIDNLSGLRAQILRGSLSFKRKFSSNAPFRFILKKATFTKESRQSGVIFSDNQREWKNSTSYDSKIDFRIMGLLPINFHILSSLWIDTIGVKFDSILSENVYGNRLKRPNQKNSFIDQENLKEPKQDYESHFRAYLWDYQKWQENGIKAIKESIENKKKVLAITTDIQKYYNNIDPNFIDDNVFLAEYGIAPLSDFESQINRLFLRALKEWSKLVSDVLPESEKDKYHDHLGIPIGLGASKIIANLLLIQFDRDVIRKLNPIYYGRYVDDIFLVVNDSEEIESKIGLHNYLKSRLPQLEDYPYSINLPNEEIPTNLRYLIDFSPNSFIIFSQEKEKIFSLQGESGETMIGMIQEELNESSSEWKMLPDGNEEYERTAKEILSASSDSSEKATGLRKSDGITVKRQQFALYLRNTEDLVVNLPEIYWKKNMDNFIKLCMTHVFTPSNIGTYSKYLRRIYRLLAFGNRIDELQRIWFQFDNCLNSINAQKGGYDKQISSYRSQQMDTLLESIYSGMNLVNGIDNKSKKRWDVFFEKVFMFENFEVSKSEELFFCDLHLLPFKTIFHEGISFSERIEFSINDENGLLKFDHFYINRNENNGEFLNKHSLDRALFWEKYYHKSGDLEPSLYPSSLVLYTRKMSVLEITQLIKDWPKYFYHDNEIEHNYFKYALMTYNHPKSLIDSIIRVAEPKLPKIPDIYLELEINTPERKSENPVFAVTSYETSEKSWDALVKDLKDPDPDRIFRLHDLLDGIISCRKHIDYVVLPELSIPRKALNLICKRLKNKGISLISGIEYKFDSHEGVRIAVNQLIYVLCVEVEGVMQQIQITQDKIIPAHHEGIALNMMANYQLRALSTHKYIVRHNGFFMSGLICNELLDIDYRSELRGRVDSLIIVEWNPDIETFSPQVEAASNDLHCFIVQVNNRKYGDTRIRAPYKESFKRDLARVKGGELDYFVVSTLSVDQLRHFHRNHLSPNEPFKPMPTGFKMSSKRRSSNIGNYRVNKPERNI